MKGFLGAYLALSFLLFGCSSPSVKIENAQTYTAIEQKDFSFLGRTRVEFNIVSPNAKTSDQFAQTAIKAALEKQKETNAQVVFVQLLPSSEFLGTGDAYAIARYAPDGKGISGDEHWTWEVEVAMQPLTQKEIAISKLWWAYRSSYQKDGLTDESRLKEFIAKKLKITIDSVILPWVMRSKYEPIIK